MCPAIVLQKEGDRMDTSAVRYGLQKIRSRVCYFIPKNIIHQLYRELRELFIVLHVFCNSPSCIKRRRYIAIFLFLKLHHFSVNTKFHLMSIVTQYFIVFV